MEKRTQRGHSGQSTDRSGAGGSRLLRKQPNAIAVTNTRGRSDLLPARCPPRSRAVRALSGVTVLCPFLHERRSLTRRLGSLRARSRRCPSTITVRSSARASAQQRNTGVGERCRCRVLHETLKPDGVQLRAVWTTVKSSVQPCTERAACSTPAPKTMTSPTRSSYACPPAVKAASPSMTCTLTGSSV